MADSDCANTVRENRAGGPLRSVNVAGVLRESGDRYCRNCLPCALAAQSAAHATHAFKGGQ